ncbi:hypothetical protein IL314_15080 [Enterococcus faecium]|nr:hypothetical protein [Enterococcus faecium]MBK5039595.1 hypothetical protein [Enterococcus faecium]MBK5044513.1 hypothetical protein [Enterococcus faecium]MBK5069450.1 hypothetical protein [Enterococcus faecium]MBK5132678.1 hypothetical protein [Enterococcus faecium]
MYYEKKSLIIGLLSIGLTFILVIAFSLSKKTETIDHTTAKTTSSVIKSNYRYPTLAKVKACQGSDIQVLGKTQIVTVLFQNKKIAVLSTENGKEIQLPIQITDKKNNLFEIPKLLYSPKNLKIGEIFGLAQKEQKYFAYQLQDND